MTTASDLGPSEPGAQVSWVSLTLADLMLSVRAPRDWEVEPLDAHSARLHADTADAGQHRTTMSFEEGYPEEPGHEWFDWFTVVVIEPLETDVPGFELLSSDRFRLSSIPGDVYLVTFRRDGGPDEPGVGPTSQLMAWIWAGDQRMYVVSGACARAREAEDLPVLEAVLRSARLLPPRPPWLTSGPAVDSGAEA